LIPEKKCCVEEVEYSGRFDGPNGGYELVGCVTVEAVLSE
jgi:hypothetical protein